MKKWKNKADMAKSLQAIQLIQWQGEYFTLQDWATQLGYPLNVLRRRFNQGLRGDELFAPVGRKKEG